MASSGWWKLAQTAQDGSLLRPTQVVVNQQFSILHARRLYVFFMQRSTHRRQCPLLVDAEPLCQRLEVIAAPGRLPASSVLFQNWPVAPVAGSTAAMACCGCGCRAFPSGSCAEHKRCCYFPIRNMQITFGGLGCFHYWQRNANDVIDELPGALAQGTLRSHSRRDAEPRRKVCLMRWRDA
jgi:hypothetical protein